MRNSCSLQSSTQLDTVPRLSTNVKDILWYTKPGDNPANWKIALPEDLIKPTIKWYQQVTGHPESKRLHGQFQQRYYRVTYVELLTTSTVTFAREKHIKWQGIWILPRAWIPINPVWRMCHGSNRTMETSSLWKTTKVGSNWCTYPRTQVKIPNQDSKPKTQVIFIVCLFACLFKKFQHGEWLLAIVLNSHYHIFHHCWRIVTSEMCAPQQNNLNLMPCTK